MPPRIRLSAPVQRADGLHYVTFSRPAPHPFGGTASGPTPEFALREAWAAIGETVGREVGA